MGDDLSSLRSSFSTNCLLFISISRCLNVPAISGWEFQNLFLKFSRTAADSDHTIKVSCSRHRGQMEHGIARGVRLDRIDGLPCGSRCAGREHDGEL
jgi:hypothetical protein